ncbi:usherin [Triplophysa dalaica]|uniref:usherin n=1 Tax=Triplophysa dalaica TaxID=1582913 RepID=UPI0024DF7CA1|nr:usherin [Triplophysa dalaica]XP_056620946.1 usherin [Triplophysa dalaica]XP_056620947.1 usherin [Triplophysa dalaica]XP_056620948.1 usherin [Triplophysa dalaica]XP_056620950.1 usherin [Triplophysa dalaica]
MAGVGLLLFALILAVILHKTLNKSAFTRERPPLVALPLHRQTPLAKYPPSNSYLFDMVPDTVGASNSVTLKAFTMHMEEVIEEKVMKGDVSPEGETGLVTVSGLYTQNLLQRSVSQLMDSKDQDPWEPHFRRLDSGLFEGEEFVDSIKGFSTVRKEHTMFTDTNL